MFDYYKQIFTSPKTFYERIKGWNYGDVIKFLFIILLIPYIINLSLELIVELQPVLGITTSAVVIVAIFSSIIGLLIIPFINSFLTHIGVLIVGAKGYQKTYLATGSAMSIMAPYLLVEAVLIFIRILNPGAASITNILGLFILLGAFVHLIYTEVIGLKVLHGLTTGKAIIAALVIPIVIGLLFIILLIFFFAALFMISIPMMYA